MGTRVDKNGNVITTPDEKTGNGTGYTPYAGNYSYTPTQSSGYNPQSFDYQKIQDSAAEGQRASTDPEGLRGVSEATRSQNQRLQQGYQQGDRVTEAQTQLANVMNSKPAGYNSKYSQALSDILNQIQNPEAFNYSFNGDELFKQYADLYTQQGRQASMDAMGQAAGLTGGYGNSYAQQVGNQAYQQYLLGLYEKGDQLRQQAYNEYQGRRADQYNQLNALMAADDTDYGRYRDEMADWQADRDYYTTAEERAYGRDYNEFANDRDYWSQQQQLENADWWNAAQFNEQMRQNDAARQLQIDTANAQNQLSYDQLAEEQAQFGANYDENVRQYNENMAEQIRQYENSLAEQSRQFGANYDEGIREFDESQAENARQFDEQLAENRRQYDTTFGEDQRQFDEQLAENIRQFDAGQAENARQFNEQLAESVRQFDATTKLDWAKLEENQRQYDAGLSEEQRQYDRNLAVDYCQAILANGQMPSAELLVAAGLSQEDAEKIRAQLVEAAGGGGGGSGNGGRRSGSGKGNGNGEDAGTNSGGSILEPYFKAKNEQVNGLVNGVKNAAAAAGNAVNSFVSGAKEAGSGAQYIANALGIGNQKDWAAEAKKYLEEHRKEKQGLQTINK